MVNGDAKKCAESLEIEAGLCFTHADRDALLCVCVCFGSFYLRATKVYSKLCSSLRWQYPADLLGAIRHLDTV